MSSEVEKKLNEIIIPVVDFKETTLEEVVEFLRAKSVEFDRSDLAAEEQGVRFVVPDSTAETIEKVQENVSFQRFPGEAEYGHGINLEMENVPLKDALFFSMQLFGTRYEIDGEAVVIIHQGEGRIEVPSGRSIFPKDVARPVLGLIGDIETGYVTYHRVEEIQNLGLEKDAMRVLVAALADGGARRRG